MDCSSCPAKACRVAACISPAVLVAIRYKPCKRRNVGAGRRAVLGLAARPLFVLRCSVNIRKASKYLA